jgi:hypothetical protein
MRGGQFLDLIHFLSRISLNEDGCASTKWKYKHKTMRFFFEMAYHNFQIRPDSTVNIEEWHEKILTG